MGYLPALLLALLPLTQAMPTSPLHELAARDAKDQLDTYQNEATANMKAILATRTSGCTLDNVVVRKEWNALTLEERINYTDAVVCLHSKDPLTPLAEAPGVRNRFDDFQLTHINISTTVHWNVRFLPWHRYLMHTYETALRDECGYTGRHPYWDWALNGANISAQAMFSGAEGSLGGNGIAIPGRGPINITVPTSPPTYGLIDPGTGGGCIFEGPFVNLTSNLGPSGPPLSTTAFNYNPTCIERDLRPARLTESNTYEHIISALAGEDLDTFNEGLNTMHGGGHMAIGGLQGDLFASNGDPAFYLHHAQVDRIWSIWQALDFESRRDQVTGTMTLMDTPPSEKGTIDVDLNLGYNAGYKTARDLASTIDGDLCYIYE